MVYTAASLKCEFSTGVLLSILQNFLKTFILQNTVRPGDYNLATI